MFLFLANFWLKRFLRILLVSGISVTWNPERGEGGGGAGVRYSLYSDDRDDRRIFRG